MALLHRAFTLVVLLIGVGLGLLVPRPWAEGGEAEAKGKGATFRCLVGLGNRFGDGILYVHNPTASDTTVDITRISEAGGATLIFDDNPVAAGQSKDYGPLQPGALVVKSAAPILVDVIAYDDGGSHQAACFRGK